MYYKDLSCYRNESAESDDMMIVYPQILNVGWLDIGHRPTTGTASAEFTKKLKELIFLDMKNKDDRRSGVFNDAQAVKVHVMHMRGSPHQCPYCSKEISLEPEQVQTYQGSRKMVLGLNELSIPSKDGKFFYAAPTLIYHYVAEHDYLPPQGFIDAVLAFDLHLPYDVEDAQGDLDSIEVPRSQVDSHGQYTLG
jgi:hypothetical protein